MANAVKIIIVSLILLCVVSIFYAFTLYTEVGKAKNESATIKESLDEEMQKAESVIRSLKGENRKLGERANTLEVENRKIAAQRDDIKSKYDIVANEREALIRQLRDKPAVAARDAAPSSGDDEYWSRILKEKASLQARIDNMKASIGESQMATEEALRAKNDLELKLSSVTQQKEDLTRKLEYNKRMGDILSQELFREKDDKRKLMEQVRGLKSQDMELKRQLKKLSYEKVSLEKELDRINREKGIMGHRIDELKTTLREKTDVMDRVRERLQSVSSSDVYRDEETKAVELPPIVVRSDTRPSVPVAAGLTGQIIAVNRENNFVVIDMGEDNGLTAGTSLGVYRAESKIANLKVIQTRREISAADIVDPSAGVIIKVGDTVKTLR